MSVVERAGGEGGIWHRRTGGSSPPRAAGHRLGGSGSWWMEAVMPPAGPHVFRVLPSWLRLPCPGSRPGQALVVPTDSSCPFPSTGMVGSPEGAGQSEHWRRGHGACGSLCAGSGTPGGWRGGLSALCPPPEVSAPWSGCPGSHLLGALECLPLGKGDNA